ncbi:MAG: glycosyltransferase family 9 protein [bacterium]
MRLSSLGDTVLITPILRELKSRFPDSHISVLVKEEYAPVFENNPHVDRLIGMDVRGRHRGLGGLRRFIVELREQGFDIFLDLHRNLRSRLVTFRIRAKRKFWYNKRRWQRLAMVHAKWLPAEPRHTVDLYFDGLRPLGVEPNDRRPEVFLTGDEIFFAQDFLRSGGIVEDKGLVGIHIGAKGEAKRWLPERFAHVSDVLSEHGWSPIFFGGEGDQQFLEEIRSAMRYGPTILRQLPLRQLIALIDQCSVFLCHDSGPMHLAVARKVPVVALFGPTHPKLGFWPLGERDVVLRAEVGCSPCSLHGTRRCRKRVRECMELISVDRVLEAVVQTLDGRREGVGVGTQRGTFLQDKG